MNGDADSRILEYFEDSSLRFRLTRQGGLDKAFYMPSLKMPEVFQHWSRLYKNMVDSRGFHNDDPSPIRWPYRILHRWSYRPNSSQSAGILLLHNSWSWFYIETSSHPYIEIRNPLVARQAAPHHPHSWMTRVAVNVEILRNILLWTIDLANCTHSPLSHVIS